MAVKAGDAFVDFQGDFSSLQKQVGAAIAPLTSKFGKLGKTATVGLAGVAVGAAAAGKALYDIGAQFDAAYDTIHTKTGASGKELGKLEQSFKNVVSSVPVDFGTAADAVAGLNQRMSLTGKPLDRLAKQLSALSVITGDDINESVAATTRLFGDWSVKTKDQTKTLDELFRLTQQTGIGFSDLERFMVQFGSPLRQLGFHFEESAAMFARFEREGVNMQTLLPGLRMALKNIAVPTDDLAKLFKQLGINTKDPHDALLAIFDVMSKDKVSEADQTLLASSVFGGRAWADMKAAIEEGRFEFSDLIKTMKGGDETIRGSERSTRDFSEQWTLFKNRVMVWLEPLATKVFGGLADAMQALNQVMSGKSGFSGAIDSVVQSLKNFWNQSAVFRGAVKIMGDIVQRVFAGIKQMFQSSLQVIRGVVKVISGVLTGNWGRAWDGVKDIFQGGIKGVLGILRTATAPIREVASRIGEVLSSVFDRAVHKVADLFTWLKNKIVGIFDDIKNAIKDALGWIENAVNDALVALGIKDESIEFTPAPAGPRGPTSSYPAGPGGPLRRQFGGPVPGTRLGDHVPAMLEGGEYVLNKNLTKAIGRPILDLWNHQMVPRMASGGYAGMQPGITKLIQAMIGRFGGVLFSGYRAGDDGFHGQGLAGDWVGGDWAGAAKYVNSIGPSLLEGIYTGAHGGPQVSWDSGSQVPPSFWGSDWAPHSTHIHVAISEMVKAIAKSIGKLNISGKGPLADVTRAAAEKVRAAANRYLASKGGMSTFDTAGFKGSDRQLMMEISKQRGWSFPDWWSLDAAETSHGANLINPDSSARLRGQFLSMNYGKYGPGSDPAQNPTMEQQIVSMAEYISERYGNPTAAWAFHQANNWYKQGGLVDIPWFGQGADFVARKPQIIGVGDRVGGERVTVGAANGNRRYEMRITNWRDGTGYMREIADDSTETGMDESGRLSRQLARQRR